MSYNKTLEEGLKELDREFPDIFHLPEGGMSVWLEESYTNQLKSFLTSFAEKLKESVVEEVGEMCDEMKNGYNCRECGSEGYDCALDRVKNELLAQLKSK